jgi:hypothetical protein
LIGEGGTGQVCVAEQQQPVQGRVVICRSPLAVWTIAGMWSHVLVF